MRPPSTVPTVARDTVSWSDGAAIPTPPRDWSSKHRYTSTRLHGVMARKDHNMNRQRGKNLKSFQISGAEIFKKKKKKKPLKPP